MQFWTSIKDSVVIWQNLPICNPKTLLPYNTISTPKKVWRKLLNNAQEREWKQFFNINQGYMFDKIYPSTIPNHSFTKFE